MEPPAEADARPEPDAPRPRRRRRKRTAPDPAAPATADPSDEAPPEGIELPTRFQKGEPGAQPGIELAELAAMPRWKVQAPVTCIDYGPERFETHTVENLDAFVESRRPDWVKVRWINVDGLDPAVIRALAIKYGLHPLAIEDLFNIDQRPKVETFEQDGDRRRPHLRRRPDDPARRRSGSRAEQISIFVGHNTVLTFQEAPGDIWDPIRNRLAKPGSRFRELDASYLLYALIDAIVDHCYPVLEHYGDRLEDLEDQVIDRPDRQDDSGNPSVEARPAPAAARGLAGARGDQRPDARAARVRERRRRAPTCATSTTTPSRSWTSSRPTARSPRASSRTT